MVYRSEIVSKWGQKEIVIFQACCCDKAQADTIARMGVGDSVHLYQMGDADQLVMYHLVKAED